ncbi:hypothetical protein NDU88_002295 [Pleurodeles waltl]|uniref:Uncharacterized protein n=1 Tax=Pleurodeles waltl TaxID=8319 RepID=A0AAV7VA56_PLEWA|nr:hypothetical protein NDU88_002295 [Pleurodeles waltl]
MQDTPGGTVAQRRWSLIHSALARVPPLVGACPTLQRCIERGDLLPQGRSSPFSTTPGESQLALVEGGVKQQDGEKGEMSDHWGH